MKATIEEALKDGSLTQEQAKEIFKAAGYDL
jgi:hypothetical protein